MSRLLFAALAGALFGAGLVVSGLSNPNKVLGFLDIFGDWDPSLAVMMGTAVIGTALGFRWVWRRQAPACDTAFHVPASRVIDRPLVVGAVFFGLGWGLTGYCPGPALTALVIHPAEGVPFVLALLAGAALRRWQTRD
ncbi:YeeE/YedE family protein [Marinihelvus fidelis]|uniref:YeeE/YedE family protein n=1 Tax=Marinihelvus fidelis TaxID=2613842 RepID=A0A5N0T8Z5_9GAMM|nr:DUF6691 family protein [Marinihelvus fidelis]KAA9131485.1 YeeE/YedE family protein [Marinihelvus fidelis]